MQYDMSEIAVFFMINMVEEFDEDLLFFFAGLLEAYEQLLEFNLYELLI
jgi:hypothetical protein